MMPGPLGRRDTLADIGASVMAHLGVAWTGAGQPWRPRRPD
jgi:phosphopentomutase